MQANPFFCLRRGGGTGTACSPFGGNGGRTMVGFGSSTSCKALPRVIRMQNRRFNEAEPFAGESSASDVDGTCRRTSCTESGFCTVRSGISAAVSRTVRI